MARAGEQDPPVDLTGLWGFPPGGRAGLRRGLPAGSPYL
jgi:hypothetical protein